MPLTDQEIAIAEAGISRCGKVTQKPYKLFDELGLYLLISIAGGKWWRFRYRFLGKQNTLSCGTYPAVSLEMARRRRDEFRALLAKGKDPSQHLKALKAAQHAEAARQLAATRFMLDSAGALTFQLGNKYLALTPAETSELRTFLNATCNVIPKVTPCP